MRFYNRYPQPTAAPCRSGILLPHTRRNYCRLHSV